MELGFIVDVEISGEIFSLTLSQFMKFKEETNDKTFKTDEELIVVLRKFIDLDSE